VSSHSVNRFDYVIVAAGSTGCVLANRLTETIRTARRSTLELVGDGRAATGVAAVPKTRVFRLN
jgi:hypothetical protein